MLDFFVDDFLVAVDREVVTLLGDVGLGNAEALSRSLVVFSSLAFPLLPTT